ncbi:LysR family transcriptional regulator [Paraburkholderia acidipaludis]|uniref:LysR family transcriptional regulator n=1 Tax=Paraburkholderia acidipaludis TaxID=660537 RepID=UPI0004838401|nr:LysR family transcriptional regulator [Paraburkholderia acidipaludis]
MDRIEAMKVFIAALDENSLAGAGRRLGRSPAAVSRAIAFLETHTGTPLLYRTTRTLKLSEAGERYALACRRILADLEEADMLVADERSAPRGLLTLTGPVAAGEDVLRPLLDEFIDRHPEVSARLQLLDRPVSLIDEGIDVALRFAHLADSTLVAVPIGEVRRVVVASPDYLAAHPAIHDPADLAGHPIISMTHFGLDSWSFPTAGKAAIPQVVQFAPRLTVNTIRGAVASALAGHGLTRLFSYHVAEHVQSGALKIVLRDAEHAPLPIHLLTPQGRLSVPKVRAFVDFATPRLRAHFTRLQRITDHD